MTRAAAILAQIEENALLVHDAVSRQIAPKHRVGGRHSA